MKMWPPSVLALLLLARGAFANPLMSPPCVPGTIGYDTCLENLADAQDTAMDNAQDAMTMQGASRACPPGTLDFSECIDTHQDMQGDLLEMQQAQHLLGGGQAPAPTPAATPAPVV